VSSANTDLEQKRLQELYAEIATLAGGLAHEIKNPLSTISLNVEILAEELAESDNARDRRMITKLQTVQKECHHLEDILNAFLKFASLRELDLVEADLNELVADFIEFYLPKADEHEIDISQHPATDLPLVKVDPALIRQILMNLALNAQQAMPEGGMLELQTYYENDFVHLDVIDTGCGIKESVREKIFDAFFSTRSGGSGLGLPTVRKIIDAHGGSITCESELGKGTRFKISLPAA